VFSQCTEPRVPRLRRRSGLHVGVRRIATLVLLVWQAPVFGCTGTTSTAWEAFGPYIPAAFLTTPYLWSYDQILYLIPVSGSPFARRSNARLRCPFIFMTVLVLGSIVAL